MEALAEVPNILETAAGLRVLAVRDNRVRLDDPSSFPYEQDASVTKEWIEMAVGALSLRGSASQTRKQAVSPALLLGYSHAHGDRILERAAQGIARSLDADFLRVNVEDVSAVFRHLYQELRRRHEFRPLPDLDSIETQQTFAQFLQDRVKNGMGLGDLMTQLAAKPATTVLEYLEHCMKLAERAATRRVIYLASAGGAAALESPLLLNEVQLFLLERRAAGSPSDSLFIFSDGSSFNPQATKPPPLDVSVVRTGEDDEDGHAFAVTRTAALTVARKAPKMDGGEPFSWLFDADLCAPRVLIVPPKATQRSQRHFAQIESDHRICCFQRNYKALRTTLKDIGRTSASSLLANLPGLREEKEKEKEEEEAERLLMKLMPRVFVDKVWGRAEMTTLCLSILATVGKNAAEQVGSDAVSVVIEAVDDFSKNRSNQSEGAQHLKLDHGTAVGGDGRRDKVERLLKLEELDKHEKKLAACIIRPESVKTSFEDIGALDSVKKTLHELILLRLERPDYFTKGILRDSVSGILLFGPPGTGKTMLAKAVAAQSGANFIAVNSSSIFDMYVGEGEKNVKVLRRGNGLVGSWL